MPLRRIDLSGYGASIFSDWRQPDAVPPAIIKAQFETLRGRTAFEVVEAESILYPYGIRVVRTITMSGSITPGFGVALPGAPQIPRGGGWGMGVRRYTEAAPAALPSDFPVPLVRPNGTTDAWHLGWILRTSPLAAIPSVC